MPSMEDLLPNKSQRLPISALKDSVIGVEARHFLQRLLAPGNEPLVSALGGSPFRLKTYIENQLETFKNEGIDLVFVFNGMSALRSEYGDWGLEGVDQYCAEGWALYDRGEAELIVPTFTKAEVIKPERYYKMFQQILSENGVDFLVAPYSAAAQLSYMMKSSEGFIDAVVGSAELLLYDVDKIIFHLDAERQQFSWVSKEAFLNDELRMKSQDKEAKESVFIDACILAGVSTLPAFPPLESASQPGKTSSIQGAYSMMSNTGGSVTSLCTHYQENVLVKQMNYLESYRRVRLAVQYQVIFADDGRATTLRHEKAPSDVHEFMGQRLPDELYFYLSKGLISPNVLNWLASGENRESAPIDGGESEEYRKLIRDKLSPMRAQSLALLSQPLHRYFYSKEKDIRQRMWYEKGQATLLNHRDLSPDPHGQTSTWYVSDALIKEARQWTKASPRTITFALEALTNGDFASKTLVERRKSDNATILASSDEVICNTIWRFLHVHGYIDSKHALTALGKAFLVIRSNVRNDDLGEEAAYFAVELIRTSMFNTKDMFPIYSGKPLSGSELDRDACLILSRVGCLSSLHHQPIGYNGPLNRHILGFSSIVNAIRRHSRDLIEVTLVSLLLNGEADREKLNWQVLGLSLPFSEERNCGTGIAVKTLLDLQVKNKEDKENTEPNDVILERTIGWFSNSVDLVSDLNSVWTLWSAITKAIEETAITVDTKHKERLAQIDKWVESNIQNDIGMTTASKVAKQNKV